MCRPTHGGDSSLSRRLLLATLALVTTIAMARQADASEIRTVTPVADSYVSSSSPASNYGSATALRIDGSPVMRSYLRFNVPALSAPVNRATLKVYVNRRVSAGITVRSVADTSWDERSIKWSNAPAFGGAVGSSGSSLSAGWVSIDVTPLVSAGGPVSLALTSSSSNAIAVGSREYSTHAPQLVVETAATYSGEVTDDAPAGYWRLGEAVGGDAFDRTSAGQTGSYVGGTTLGVKGALGGDPDTAAGFDGAGGGVEISAAGGPLDVTTGSFAVEAWINTTVNGEEAIASKQSDYARPGWQVTVTDDGGAEGLVRAKLDDGSAAIQGYGPQIRVDDGRWHHVVVDFDRASGITIYVDGSASRSTAGAVPGSLSNSAPLRVGQAASWYPTFSGQLDEVAVYP